MSPKRSVLRHKIELVNVRKMYTSDTRLLSIDFANIHNHASNLPGFFSLAQRLTCEAVVLAESPSTIRRYARLTAELAYASFKVGNPTVTKKEFKVEEQRVIATEAISESQLHAGRWLSGVDWNIIAGSKSQMHELLDFPTKILASSSTSGPAFHSKLVDLYKAFFGETKSFPSKLRQAVDSRKNAAGDKWVKHIGSPTSALLAAVFRDQSDVSDEVYDALLGHRIWYESDEDFRLSPDGFIAIRVCALVKLARERKLEINVESDYLPDLFASTSARKKS